MALREYYHRRYPLAYSRPFLEVEDRQVLARVQEETGLDSQVWMVVDTGQYALSPRTDRASTQPRTDLIRTQPTRTTRWRSR